MSLLTNLVSYWKLDEASGNRADAHGANTLTDSASGVPSTTGVISNGAGLFSGNTPRFLSHADNSDLSTGDIDWTFSAWVKFNTIGVVNIVIGKDGSSSGEREYMIGYIASTLNRFFCSVFKATDNEVQAVSNNFG